MTQKQRTLLTASGIVFFIVVVTGVSVMQRMGLRSTDAPNEQESPVVEPERVEQNVERKTAVVKPVPRQVETSVPTEDSDPEDDEVETPGEDTLNRRGPMPTSSNNE